MYAYLNSTWGKGCKNLITNAYDLYQGLMDMEVDTELIIFKGMAYSSDQPGVHVAIMKQNLMWFSHYMLEESMEGFRTL